MIYLYSCGTNKHKKPKTKHEKISKKKVSWINICMLQQHRYNAYVYMNQNEIFQTTKSNYKFNMYTYKNYLFVQRPFSRSYTMFVQNAAFDLSNNFTIEFNKYLQH